MARRYTSEERNSHQRCNSLPTHSDTTPRPVYAWAEASFLSPSRSERKQKRIYCDSSVSGVQSDALYVESVPVCLRNKLLANDFHLVSNGNGATRTVTSFDSFLYLSPDGVGGDGHLATYKAHLPPLSCLFSSPV